MPVAVPKRVETEDGMAERAAYFQRVRIAVAIALTAAMVSAFQPRPGSSPVRRDDLRLRSIATSNLARRLSVASPTSRTERMKAVAPRDEQEHVRPIHHNHGVSGLPAAMGPLPVGYPTYSGPFRTHNRLRC